MTTLLAILLQVGPPTGPCVDGIRQPWDAPVQCTGGYLVPRQWVVDRVAAPRICAERIDRVRKIADERVRACSVGVEVLHATLDHAVGIFERAQADALVADVEPTTEWGSIAIAVLGGIALGMATNECVFDNCWGLR